jgi:hypothetical protein
MSRSADVSTETGAAVSLVRVAPRVAVTTSVSVSGAGSSVTRTSSEPLPGSTRSRRRDSANPGAVVTISTSSARGTCSSNRPSADARTCDPASAAADTRAPPTGAPEASTTMPWTVMRLAS